jgi:epoxyqueuosine reductase QueG
MDIQALAAEHGFAACYVFQTEPFTNYERRYKDGALHWAAKDLSVDVRETAPWANAIVALIYPYRPYADGIPVSGNYPASNASYHAAGRLMRALKDQGITAERGEVPIRELLTRNGTGTMLKSGLTYLPGFGTRYSVQTILAKLSNPQYTPAKAPEKVGCCGCHACERICPSGAISDDGYDFQACARAYMGGDPMDQWVMDAMNCILGCELCQKVCPYNFGIESIVEMPEAFRLEEILKGNIKPVLQIVGANLNKNGRIIQHACVIAARLERKDLIPLIETWQEDAREGVRVAAGYALEKLRG